MEPIKIMVLGMSGAGKTVYLASLHHKLNVQGNEGCYALTTSPSMRTRLSGVYESVRDPSREWPLGTRHVDLVDIPFDCVVDNQYGKFVVMKLLYLDYALGLDRQNQAAAGRTHRFTIDVVGQPFAPRPDVRSLDVDVSYDAGPSWRVAQVPRRRGAWQVTVHHPASAEYVSLRVRAEGAGGAAVTEETIRAYQLR